MSKHGLAGTTKTHKSEFSQSLKYAIREIKQARKLLRNGLCKDAFWSYATAERHYGSLQSHRHQLTRKQNKGVLRRTFTISKELAKLHRDIKDKCVFSND
jgi:hypothetical protein